MRFRDNLIVLEHAASTNSILFHSSLEQYPFGTALLAKTQSAGRGRAGRVWQSEVGGLYLSVLFKPDEAQGLALLGAYSVTRLCRELFGLPAQIRWPNDVYLKGRKLAGILPQAKFSGQVLERVVLGVGLNVAQSSESFDPDLVECATTLSHHLSEPVELCHLANELLDRIDDELERLSELGCADLCRRCEPFLEGLGGKMIARVVDTAEPQREPRLLGPVEGLGPIGQLRLSDGHTFEHLGPTEKLQLI